VLNDDMRAQPVGIILAKMYVRDSNGGEHSFPAFALVSLSFEIVSY